MQATQAPTIYSQWLWGFSTINVEVSKIEKACNQMAKRHLTPVESSNVFFYKEPSYDYFPYLFPHHHHHYHYYDQGSLFRHTKPNNQSDKILVGIVFGIIAIGTAFFVGRECANLWNGFKDFKTSLTHEYKLSKYREFQHKDTDSTMQRIVKKVGLERKIAFRRTMSALVGVSIKVSLLSSSILGVVGACVASQALIGFAVAGALGFGVAIAMKSAFDTSDETNRSDARKLQRA